jgi:hypothetical protein
MPFLFKRIGRVGLTPVIENRILSLLDHVWRFGSWFFDCLEVYTPWCLKT